ncbi:lichenan-specific phosphotransferase enzyme iia component (pts system lichenan-specific eiia component) (eiia-lic) (eiii-lic) [Streptococcus pneumoniae]|uniref:Lichenan-specific phosphotransferase enzyme iia component (Pts system lichenan-specific eiia component) (Eiia-lic) (Eiii-lic) n=2 Tax=Streptococcus pneumoniae TaxID=1313 RepID=A0A0B7LKG7_STREE|nr:PTS lactose/cellobiose transporter subunit IIA [Streptococcus pneumoniae]EDK69768.1 Phosphotransferase system (PTS) cellobiose-specific component IIA, putative [Streptococcus pneumoniae SP19-BS75]EHD26845.1 PTS system, Lactose/Cellobiose specific IIA subunit [Streptococcus pneumoniae GA11184]EHD32814.1 PTS system, Lactose/Cellobiose specific IIA subunit [Streptococcus pneumoniae 6735-05]EHD41522.1 PTS system, Lactose/Cellobiose specific IIA subunit [Streptococcus pneumoniae GA43265]EHD48670
MDESNLESVMGLIMYGGEAKSNAMEAIQAAKKGDFSKANRRLADANAALLQAHKAQTEMLTREAQGEKTSISLLMVHAQDHLMTSLTFVDLAKEVVEVYERFEKN